MRTIYSEFNKIFQYKTTKLAVPWAVCSNEIFSKIMYQLIFLEKEMIKIGDNETDSFNIKELQCQASMEEVIEICKEFSNILLFYSNDCKEIPKISYRQDNENFYLVSK